MTKARFYVKDKVQDVGYRVHIMQKILNSGLNGATINLADGRVEVRLEGEKERIDEFYEELKKENTPELVMGKPEFHDLEFNADLMVPDSMRSSQALMLEQLSKGIGYIAGMNERKKGLDGSIKGMDGSIKGMNGSIKGMDGSIKGMDETIKGMDGSIKGMDESIKGMDGSIKGMDGSIKGIDKSIKGMDEKLDKLPARIAKELKELLEGRIK